MDFREGGSWLYFMVGPEGEEHFCRNDYKTIKTGANFTSTEAFCDENGSINTNFPVMDWDCHFSETETGTMINIDLTLSSKADMEQLTQMGFKEGFTSALENLDGLLKKERV